MPFGAFDPETVELLSAVLAAASAELEKDRPRYSKAVKTELTRVLTRNLLVATDAGERDPQN
jgi:hypothetical protein